MPRGLFPFLQADLPFELGPPDGRFPLRDRPGGEISGVVVLSTIGAEPRPARGAREKRRRRPTAATDAPAVTVPVTRATVIDVQPLADEREAEAWLQRLDAKREQARAFARINRLLHAHRIATADPYVHEIHPSQALTVRVGFGDGEQVAEGGWLLARELAPAPVGRQPRGRRRRVALAAHQESRLAALHGARKRSLLCEELALRARLDLDHGRPELAALELERAYAVAMVELPVGAGVDLARRVGELEALRSGVGELATAVIAAAGAAGAAPVDHALAESQGQTMLHALERLEAALRAHALTEADH